MAKTGRLAPIVTGTAAAQARQRTSSVLHFSMLAALMAGAILCIVAIPLTVDSSSMIPGLSVALADNSNGTGDGQSKGKGNGKGRGDENGGGNPSQGSSAADGDDDSGDDGSHAGDNDRTTGELGGESGDDNADGFGDVDESSFAGEMADVTAPPAEATTGPVTQALPTIREIFALGQESVLDSEQEMLAIKNGWNLQN